MKNRCEVIRERIAPLLFEDLEAEERKEVEDHLENCPACAQQRSALETTLARMREVEDEAVPHHFFLEPAPRPLSARALLALLPFRWKAGLGVAALLTLTLAAASFFDLRVRAGDGQLAFGFGPLGGDARQERAALEEELDRRTSLLLRAIDQQLDQRDAKLAGIFRNELAVQQAAWTKEERLAWTNYIEGLTDNLNHEFSQRQALWEADVRNFVRASYDGMVGRFRSDMEGVDYRLNQVEAVSDLHDQKMQVLSGAVLEIAQDRRITAR